MRNFIRFSIARLFGMKNAVLLFFIAFINLTFSAAGQLVSFPGAEGAGRFTAGGRGTMATPTTVYEVTNLNDDNNPGSLRYALSQTSSYRTIVFRISGTIHLTSNLNIKANTTIAGQTAPGDGICIADKPMTIAGDNIIVRYMRFRLGDRYQQAVNGNDDAFSGTGHKNIIIDHCTMSWSNDEAFTIYDGDSTTAQWNIISEPLNFSYHDEGNGIENHGYGGIWGGRKSSFHHNLIVSCVGRNPRFAGSRTLPPMTAGLENVDFRNNVIYNWGSYSTNGGEGGNYNMVNNYYKYGPSTNSNNSVSVPVKGMIVQPFQSTTAPVLPYGKFYLQGNYVDGYPNITSNNWLGVSMSGGSQGDTSLAKVTTEFTIAPVTTHTALDAYNLVLQYAGASFRRDTLDQRIINNVKTRTGRIIDVQGGYPHGTPYAATVNAWPVLNSLSAPADTDHDGMTDDFENANGLDPNDPSDRNLIASNGYTNLENYLNGIVGSPSISVVGTLNSFTQNLPSASAVQTYTLAATNITNDVVITPPPSFEVSTDGGVTWHNNSSPVTIAQTGGQVLPSEVSVRLNAIAAGSFAGNISNESTGAPVFNIPVTGNTYLTMAPPGTAAVVAQDGTGDFLTVQAAIDAAPAGLTAPYIIYIKNGKYFEKITIPSNKPFIHLVGESVANVVLYYNAGASDPLPGGGTVGTQNSASFTVNAPDFAAFNITFANTYGDGTQAVAVLVNNDRAIFKNCRFLGNQDTLYVKGSGTPKHYFKDCYIDGNVDFIFGSSIDLFDSTTLYAKTRTSTSSSYLTAANTTPGQSYGFVFRNSMIPDNTGGTKYVLGRPWQNSTGFPVPTENKVVFLNARMSGSIKPEGWAVWDAGTNTSIIYYGEYQSKNFDGSLVDISQRVPWSYQLNGTEAASYTNSNIFGSWDPCAVSPLVCTNEDRNIAIANFRGVKGATNSTFDWNISWAKTQIKYELYRSANRLAGYTKIGEATAVNDTSVNFQLTDILPVAGTSYYYYLVGSKTGFASHITDTIEISSQPDIITAGNIQAFGQNLGIPSASQTLTVSGENILGDIVITPPVNFEISNDGGTNWITNPAAISLSPVNNTVASTNLLIRLNAGAAGTYTDSIMLTTTGGVTKYVRLTGTTIDGAAVTYATIQHWPFTTNALDSAAVRAVGVLPSTPVFYNLYVSNGTQIPAIPAYSPQYGQAFGASSDGSGAWGTSAGGPGGTLQRTWYEEFTVAADNGYQVRVDSLYITGAFYNTSSNTRLAAVYSLSHFVNDSSDVFTVPGGFANPANLPNQSSGPTTVFPLSVAGPSGLILQPGETLSFRLYFSCSSSSLGRYAMLKDIRVVGSATDLSTLPGIIQHWPFTTNADDSAAVRSAAVAPSTPTFNNLYLSNGTQVPAIPAFSTQFGQAFGASADGSGMWGTSAGGPGGTLQRSWYEQFTVSANTGYQVKVDSIFVTAAFYNTSSNTRLAVVYSRDNFVNDSMDISAVPGGFANPVSLANQTSGPTNRYALAIAGIDGITLNPGETLSFRFYFSCGSSSAGRYAMLKDVQVYGLSTNLSTIPGVIQHWPFTTNALDSANVRSAGLTASTPTMNNLYVSNGTEVPAIPAYSTQFGQAFGASTDGSGSWGSSAGGPGGTLQRSWYEQFTVTARNGYTVKVDSMFVSSAFYNTSSNTRLAVVYSLSNFVNDSADVSTIPGGFANPISLPNQTGGPTNVYRLAFNGINSITLQQNETLTFRCYFSCSSSSLGRYAFLKDVQIFGLATQTGPSAEIDTANATLTAFNQNIGSPSAMQTFTVSASNLTEDLLITPPAGFEVSADGGTNWFTNTSALSLTQNAGEITPATIAVRLNTQSPGTYGGAILLSSDGAVPVNVPVAGVAVIPPGITVISSLTSFLQTLGIPSPVQTYTVSGVGLTGDILVNPPVGFEISADGGANWIANPSSLVLTNTGGTVAQTTISVRLNNASAGITSGSIVHTTPNATTITIPVNGETIPPASLTVTQSLQDFYQVLGTASAAQSYTVTGVGLTDDLSISIPKYYQVSTDGGATWVSNTLTINRNGYNIQATLLIRLNASITGTFTGNLVHASAGTTDISISLTGYTAVKNPYTIYPVPALKTIYIAYPVNTGNAVLTVYNQSGQKIASYTASAYTVETRVDISKYPAGIYTVEYKLGNAEKITMRFIKQ